MSGISNGIGAMTGGVGVSLGMNGVLSRIGVPFRRGVATHVAVGESLLNGVGNTERRVIGRAERSLGVGKGDQEPPEG